MRRVLVSTLPLVLLLLFIIGSPYLPNSWGLYSRGGINRYYSIFEAIFILMVVWAPFLSILIADMSSECCPSGAVKVAA
jgi:hypothetical protein